ncbi:hypothetical protein SAMN05216316_1660 [Nitrosovibrio sp. Nv6]|nr:hypothetical protein SAMN05216316_1660 [Nitrosovibrio sp. Nv6]
MGTNPKTSTQKGPTAQNLARVAAFIAQHAFIASNCDAFKEAFSLKAIVLHVPDHRLHSTHSFSWPRFSLLLIQSFQIILGKDLVW